MKQKPYTPLKTVDGKTLMDRPLEPLTFVVDTLISQGLHVLAGSPKVGKSWFALWLTVTIAKGESVWGMPTRPGTTLYLCLEDSERRIQNRLLSITEDAPANAHFCIESLTLEHGLEEQLEQFLSEHSDTVLIIIDTQQKIREDTGDYAYANDYNALSALKRIADQHSIAILLIHHTRKKKAEDIFECISGTTAMSGAADSSFALVESKRGSAKAILYCIGRDIEYREIAVHRDEDNIWQMDSDSGTGPGDLVASAISEFVTMRGEFIGTPTEFSEQIDPDGSLGITPKKAARQIAESIDALRLRGIHAKVYRSDGRRLIRLLRAESVDAGDTVPIDPAAETPPLCGDLWAFSAVVG